MTNYIKRFWRLIRYEKLRGIEHDKKYHPVYIIGLCCAVIIGILLCIGMKNISVLDFAENIYGFIAEKIIELTTMAATVYMCRQIKLMKDINHTEMSHEIYEDDVECRLRAEPAIKMLKNLNGTIKSAKEGELSKEFIKALYTDKAYEELRKFAYHYEYLGYMLQRECVDFHLLFNTLTFPDGLITESQDFIKAGRAFYFDDLWNGAEYLYHTYEVKRKYNKWKRLKGFCRTTDKFKECPENCENLKNCKNSREIRNCLKEKCIEAKKELYDAEENWVKFYKKLP